MNDVKREEFSRMVSEFQEKAEALDRKLEEVSTEISIAEANAFERGLAAGVAGREMDLEGKTLVIQVPEADLASLSDNLNKIQRQFKCKLVVCSDLTEIKDLHELDLRALGLKKLE